MEDNIVKSMSKGVWNWITASSDFSRMIDRDSIILNIPKATKAEVFLYKAKFPFLRWDEDYVECTTKKMLEKNKDFSRANLVKIAGSEEALQELELSKPQVFLKLSNYSLSDDVQEILSQRNKDKEALIVKLSDNQAPKLKISETKALKEVRSKVIGWKVISDTNISSDSILAVEKWNLEVIRINPSFSKEELLSGIKTKRNSKKNMEERLVSREAIDVLKSIALKNANPGVFRKLFKSSPSFYSGHTNSVQVTRRLNSYALRKGYSEQYVRYNKPTKAFTKNSKLFGALDLKAKNAEASSLSNKQRSLRKVAWSDSQGIHDIYKLRDRLTAVTGKAYEVDHIIPLQGKNISGLHHSSNLQILESSKNRSKSNKINLKNIEKILVKAHEITSRQRILVLKHQKEI